MMTRTQIGNVVLVYGGNRLIVSAPFGPAGRITTRLSLN